ncbi:hypothetical protein, partial [Streptomyces sp. EAG2]|uniref:hypothetical protein n=1 Tax=Streptomyces sp. EAG2 TaxID=2056495 RepID=UPI001CB9A5CE
GVRLRRRHRTTVSDPAAAKAPDLIGGPWPRGASQSLESRNYLASTYATHFTADTTWALEAPWAP